jgi:hypothetical protein
MRHRRELSILLSAIIVLTGAYSFFGVFHSPQLPFSIQLLNGHTAVIGPAQGSPFPNELRPGDLIDLATQPRPTRVAIDSPLNLAGLPPRSTYPFVVRRGHARVTVEVASVRNNLEGAWAAFCTDALIGVIGLLAVLRGRDRAAAGLALWATAFLTAIAISFVPADGLGPVLAMWSFYLLARVGFYVMAESMVAGSLQPRARTWWRAGFLALLVIAGIRALIGPIVFVTTGWAEMLRPAYGLIVSATYLPPVILLFVSYQHAEMAQRLRLRWMLASSALFLVAIVLNNTPLLGSSISVAVSFFLSATAGFGFLYTILRHRVVDFRVVLNRTLVYAATTSFVLGLFALFESLIERSALGHDASLIMELTVPLGLGVSLSTVHRRIDSLIDRLVFRRQYREEVALRRFARECAFVTQPDTLLDLAMDQIALHAGVPWIAMYEYTPDGYSRVRQRGTQDLPPRVAADDLALVKLRAHDPEVNLHETPSAIRRDGYAFPLRVRGHLLGVLVVGPRPGEHSVAEERELLAHVAHEVGAALFTLRAEACEARAQATEAQLRELYAREKTLMEALRAVGATTTTGTSAAAAAP